MSDPEVNMEAVGLMEDAVQTHEDGRCCPFCGMMWDQAVLDRAARKGPAAFAAAMNAIYNEPVNAIGDELGTRGATDQDEGS